MGRSISGIHHVTAIARDPQENVDFYTEVLGLRLVKKTVNFDDPGTYHLYYGDELGRPGTLLTFFPWPLARRGSRGAGQATVTSFAVPAGSLGYWRQRLADRGVSHEPPHARLEEEVLTVLDPDGLKLELVAGEGMAERPFWSGGAVPEAWAIRGLAGITLTEWNPRQTAELLTGVLGFRKVAESGDRWRFAAGGEGAEAGNVEPGRPVAPGSAGPAEQARSAGPAEQGKSAGPAEQGKSARPADRAKSAGPVEPAGWVDVLGAPAAARGQIAAGTVHHVAWRTAGDAEQAAWREELLARGLHVSPILDRRYFHSIYFREPGGVLFEIATDPPGMTADEPAASLGRDLKLPPWLEPSRAALATALPPLQVPSGAAAGVGA